jgi:phage terminase large subunit-like protein
MLVHARSGLMDWCVGNVKIEPTATAIRATKQNAGDAKIDPWCAMQDAAAVMMKNPQAGMRSYLETEGLILL